MMIGVTARGARWTARLEAAPRGWTAAQGPGLLETIWTCSHRHSSIRAAQACAMAEDRRLRARPAAPEPEAPADPLFPRGDRPLCRTCQAQPVYLAGECSSCFAAGHEPTWQERLEKLFPLEGRVYIVRRSGTQLAVSAPIRTRRGVPLEEGPPME